MPTRSPTQEDLLKLTMRLNRINIHVDAVANEIRPGHGTELEFRIQAIKIELGGVLNVLESFAMDAPRAPRAGAPKKAGK